MTRKTITRVFIFLSAIALAAMLAWKLHALPVSAPRAFDESRYAETPTALPSALPRASTTPRISLPILVYHIVRPSYASDSAAVRAIALTPETFDAELLHLQNAGYHVIGFRDLETYLASSTPLPEKPIILSFDDGWRDQFVYAFPILKKYRDTATFFVFTNALGRRKFLSWADVRALRLAGMTIGDHTRFHPYLTRITDSRQLWEEIYGSKRVLEKELGAPVTEFAYPFGQYNRDVVALVKKAGFQSARGDYWGDGIQSLDRLYTLPALNAPTTTAAFNRKFP